MPKRPNIDDAIQGFYLKKMPGMDNKTEDLELVEKVELAQNCRFENEPGSVDKRPPISYFNSSSIGSGGIVGAYRFYTSSGVTKWIVAHADKVYVGNDTAGTFTEIRDLTSTGKRMSFQTYKDLIIGSNGYDNIWVYDGSSDNLTWELGSCKAKIGSGTGITRTSVSYAVTFDTDSTVNGAISNVIATLTNQDVLLSYIPLGPAGTANRKIYRKDNTTGGAYKLVTTIADNVSTTYTDTTADVSGAATMPVVTDDMPLGTLLNIHRERLFVSGDPNSPSKIYYSNPYLIHFIRQTSDLDYMEISPEDGDEIMGIPIHMGRMICIKRNTIRLLYITSATSGQDPTTWYADDPIVFSGSPARWSIIQTSLGIIYLGWDHWYIFDGAQSKGIIDEFDVKAILDAKFSDVVSYFHENDLVAAYTDSETAPQSHNRIMRFNFKRNALSIDTLNVNCFASKRGDDENGELYYGASDNGYLYKSGNEELSYKLQDKGNCNLGTKTNIFVGGTEFSPYIEIGAISTAQAIPQNICILWDDSFTNPGSGWTELTGFDERFIKISDSIAPGTTGTCGVSSTTFADFVSKNYRVFYKNASTTEYQFPDGAIVIWDQSSPPEGFVSIEEAGKYITVSSTINNDKTQVYAPDAGSGSAGNIENILEVYLVKKVGETPSWDGLQQYVYALYYSASAPGNGWTDVTSSYTNSILKIKSNGAPVASNGSSTANKADWVQLSSVDRTESQTATAIDENGNPVSPSSTAFSGEFIDAYDRDDADNREWYALHNGDGSVTATLTHEHTWTDAKDITNIYVKMGQATFGGNYKQSTRIYTVYLKISGTWTQVDTITYNDSAGSNSTYTETRNVTLSTGWSNVTGIKVYLSGRAYSFEGNRKQQVWLRIFDVRCEGWHKTVAFHIAKKLLGKMQDWNSAIESTYTSGVWISPAINIRASSLGKLYWNEILVGSDNVLIDFRTGATQSACEAASFGTDATDPNGTNLVLYASADAWIQYRISFSATDTQVSNPRVYFSDGYVLRFTYSQVASYAEASVPFRYTTGFRHFDKPMLDKIFKKIVVFLVASQGSMTVTWTTENATGSFLVDLATFQQRWESFFQDNAMGRKISFDFYKNDLYDLRIKEIQGAYSDMLVII